MAYHIFNSDPGHMHSNQQLEKTAKITFSSLSKSTDEKEKEKKKERQLESVMRYTQTQQRKAIAKRYALHANAIT